MSHTVLDPGDIVTSTYIITHVFCPLKLPDADDYSVRNEFSLARAVATAARLYNDHIDQANLPHWRGISRMLEKLEAAVQSEDLDRLRTVAQFSNMDEGDVVALLVRAQNAGVVFRKRKNVTIYEAFEVSPNAKDVMAAQGKLICSYPGPAIEIPNDVFNDSGFCSELVNFLVHMNHDVLGEETQSPGGDTVHPRHITELLTGILRSIGRPADIPRISKRVGDDAVCNDLGRSPWRRSSLWLLIRVVLQTTLSQSPLGHPTYKEFMLFFMCCLAEEKTCADLPSDLLHFMSAKISRRLWKLGSSVPDWLSRSALGTCTLLRSVIEGRWKQVQAAQRLSPPWAPSQLDLTHDIQLSLLNSGEYLCKSLANHSTSLPNDPFTPECHPRGTLDDFLSSNSDFFEGLYGVEPHITLYDVERTVEHGIDTWVDRVTDRKNACENLEILAHKYSSGALKTYANNPELLSVMLLTTIELWIALDKIVIKEIPLLAEYSPEVSTDILENLLVCKAAGLHRLRLAHEYLSRRQSQSRESVFTSPISTNSFAVRFFRRSSHLQRLKTRIEEEAWDRVRRSAPQWYSSRHVMVPRWPLPSNQLEAEAVVFELDCPVLFNLWRAATFNLFVDVCSSSVQSSRLSYDFNNILEKYAVKHPRSCINLCFDHFNQDCYIDGLITRKKVRLMNKYGLTFNTASYSISAAIRRSDSKGHCTYKLQSRPYHRLQLYVDSTSHTSNDVVASQADCHKDLSIPEYLAFGHLRSGGILQWPNILREFRSRTLNFRHQDVHILLAQAVSQVGPLTNSGWMWHQEIREPTFCHALLGELRSLVRDIEANWLESVTMDTISFLLRRLLASSPDKHVTLDALGLLYIVRGKVYSWIQQLSDELLEVPEDDKLRGTLRDTAAICRSTFDVDPFLIPQVLNSAGDVEVLLSSAVLIHDHTPSDVSHLPAYSQLLLERDRRLSLVLEKVVSDILQADHSNQGINLVVRKVWSDFNPGSKWIQLQPPNTFWFSCTIQLLASGHPQTMHLNILDGTLLRNGKPLGTWLPDKYVQHPLYKFIFGKRTLKVVRSDITGIDYLAREAISGHQVYFSLRSNSDLVIRAKLKRMAETEVLELIPREKLQGDLPTALIDDHTHWLNLSTSILEVRPIDTLWKTSSENWKIDCTPGHYRMWNGHQHLVDIRSQSWEAVSGLLKPLSPRNDLIVTVSQAVHGQSVSSLQLSVAMPQYDLSFYVNEDGYLQSLNFRDMVYDEDQSTGTLVGLVNQLVLRPKSRGVDAIKLVPRCVIIPDGDISFRKDGHHVRVWITPNHSIPGRITYQTYRVNTDLGCLTANTGLTSKLYCAYLHALTSGCIADSLTGRCGTEEALSVLMSAGCLSSVGFGSRDAELLGLIASMCPSRTYCNSMESMQKVEWRDQPINSQDHELYNLAKTIIEHHERAQLFHEGRPSQLFVNFPTQNDHLLRRSGARWAVCSLPFKLSRRHFELAFDIRYHARDMIEAGSGEHRAYTAAACVCRRSGTAPSQVNIWAMIQSWNVDSDVPGLSLQYDKSWLSPRLPFRWLKTYDLLRKGDEMKWFQLLFSLTAMAYASPNLSHFVSVFVDFAADSWFQIEDPPQYESYPGRLGSGPPSEGCLYRYIVDSACSYELRRPRTNYDDERVRLDAHATAQMLLNHWPCETPPPCSLDPDLYDVASLESKLQRHWFDLYRNHKLREHVSRVQHILNNLHSWQPCPEYPPYSFCPSSATSSTKLPRPVLTMNKLFARPAPQLRAPNKLQVAHATWQVENTGTKSESYLHSDLLHRLIAKVKASAVNSFQHRYASALHASAAECNRSGVASLAQGAALPTAETLAKYYTGCRTSYSEALKLIQQHLGPRNECEDAAALSGQWPCITSHALFRCLASNSPIALSPSWKSCLIIFTLIALELQRARRLLLLLIENHLEELWMELQNEGCDGWEAEAHPDWLLIQLQGNFLIRRVQAHVAHEMISPRSGGNTAIQLNMGEGKTSVIVPIAAVDLANGDKLVRIIVPKSLTAQTLHVLADRLGGLTNRRIYYLPFSRSLDVDHKKVACLREIMPECMRERGILIVQPEHILSFKLVGMEKRHSPVEDSPLANPLLQLQKWLHSNSRDIVDESDEILDVRSQLVFTIGHQRPLEGSSKRWITTQHVLGIVSERASSLRESFPLGVEYEPGPPGSFPHLRILQPEAGQQLMTWVIRDVMEGLLPNINFGRLHSRLDHLVDAIRTFISCENVSPNKLRLVEEYSRGTHLWNDLLLLRGLLAGNILLFAFTERRWRVNYGLSPARTMLAVPYRAKDVPAQKAEFGQPDVATLLTCLSYYYSGLTEEQVKHCLEILYKQHDPSLDYNIWIQACSTVPESIRTFNGVNIKSTEQWNEYLFPLLTRNRETVNFYLSRVVFPKETKAFQFKLSSSGWDLAEKKGRVLTGFSGTNDGQYLLPLHIVQHELDHQRGTNAKVLSYLLQPENNHYVCTAHENGERRTALEFLEVLVSQKPEIRVLLDVGAQMLELQNHQLAKVWLDLHSNASAAIYFDEDDELMVSTRDGNAQLLRVSAFAHQLDRCVVYIDDAHTRGTDIKFPSGFRAAVTLGPKVTKDRLVQGCMRMRKLGHGHSVMFFAPLEVDRLIRSVAGGDKDPWEGISTMEILHWAIRETWENIQRWAPHWVQQGTDHTSSHAAWISFYEGKLTSKELLDRCLQSEAKRLEDLYAPRSSSNPALLVSPDFRQRCIDLEVLSLSTVGMNEEQERELVYEVEARHEREVERPAKVALPASHSIDQDVVQFVKTGVIPAGSASFNRRSEAFIPAFETLDLTSATTDEAYIWSQSVLVTKDFERTVESSGKKDDYLRPVQWIVSTKSGSNNLLVVISPYEANALLPDIKSSKQVFLHLYTPRMVKSMKPCDDLSLYSIPATPNIWSPHPSSMDVVNAFAGQLYLKDYETYVRFSRFLCMYTGDLQSEEGIEIRPDGFIPPKNRANSDSRTVIAHTFANTPVTALRALMDLRNKGIDYSSTHMGKLLYGRLLSRGDFED